MLEGGGATAVVSETRVKIMFYEATLSISVDFYGFHS